MRAHKRTHVSTHRCSHVCAGKFLTWMNYAEHFQWPMRILHMNGATKKDIRKTKERKNSKRINGRHSNEENVRKRTKRKNEDKIKNGKRERLWQLHGEWWRKKICREIKMKGLLADRRADAHSMCDCAAELQNIFVIYLIWLESLISYFFPVHLHFSITSSEFRAMLCSPCSLCKSHSCVLLPQSSAFESDENMKMYTKEPYAHYSHIQLAFRLNGFDGGERNMEHYRWKRSSFYHETRVWASFLFPIDVIAFDCCENSGIGKFTLNQFSTDQIHFLFLFGLFEETWPANIIIY